MNNKNYYHTLVPSKLKRQNYVSGFQAVEEYLISILINFIEKECGNGNKVPYVKKPDDTPVIDRESDVCIESYRGLGYGPACISNEFIILADLYFWFKFEEKEWFDDVEKDFDMSNEVPEGEEYYHFEEENENGLHRMIFNKNRKYPNYKRDRKSVV